LSERFERDGYLFFRNVIDRNKVSKVRNDIMDVLLSYDLIQNGESEPIWSGKEVADWLEIHTKIHALKSFDEFRNCSEVVSILERLSRSSLYAWMNVDVRTHTPKVAPPTAIHQDYQVFYRAGRFYIAWIPLMDVTADVGGIDIAPGSHKSVTENDYVLSNGRYLTGNEGVLLPVVPEERCGTFARSTYNAGDLLVIHDKVAHRSLPNTSKKIRLSMDVRFQPKDSFIPWYAQLTASELERYTRRAMRAMLDAGPTQEQIQKIWWTLYWDEGGEFTVDRVRSAMDRNMSRRFGSF
jgi:ectoine hydroxylase-related dioxygenase (phytanoyl-CoA dioxygenase family)